MFSLIILSNFLLTYTHASWPEASLIHTVSRHEENAFLQHSGSYDLYPAGYKDVRKTTENETHKLEKDSIYNRTVKNKFIIYMYRILRTKK